MPVIRLRSSKRREDYLEKDDSDNLLVSIASAINAAATALFVKVTDGTNTMPTGDAAPRAIFVKKTDGTNTEPSGDAAARAVFFQQSDGAASLGKLASGLDAGLTAAVPSEHAALVDNNNGTFATVNAESHFRYRVVSAANTQQQVLIDARNLHDTLAISSVGSGGTHTLVVEVSSDNANFITLDSIAAAATQIKQYTATTVGATVALSPLAFRWIRITAGAAGVGFTTTLTIGMK